MNLDSIVESVHRLLLNNLPIRTTRTPSGWMTFNCPMCNDKRKRAGIITSGPKISYNCFNCKYTTGWSTSPHIGQKFRDLATRLGAVYLSLYFLQEFLGPVNDLINYSYRALGEGLVDINFLWSKTLLKNAGLPIDFTDEDWIDFFMRQLEEFPPFKDLFKNGEVGKVIDFSNFIKILGLVLGLFGGAGGKDKAVVEVDRLNGLIEAELKRINNDYLEKYERAKDLAISGKTEDERGMLEKMQEQMANLAKTAK